MVRSLRFAGALSIFSWMAISGCGEPFTSTTGGTGGGTSSTTGTTSTSSAGGMGGGGGATSSSTGMGGSGGMPVACTDTSCGPGKFCAADETCKSCTTLDEPFEFAAPEGITIMPSSSPSFPRVREATNGPQMTFIAKVSGDNFDIATTSYDNGTGWLDGNFVSQGINTLEPESGPLVLPVGTTLPGLNLGTQDVIVFTAMDTAANYKRKIYAADLAASTSKVPVTSLNDGDESYSLAVATEATPLRYWHMYRHFVGAPPGTLVTDLVTRTPTDGAPQILNNLMLPMGCDPDVIKSPDLAPWARKDGKLLLFHAYPCGTSPAPKGFAVLVDPDTGMPTDSAVPLQVDGMANTDDLSTPSLSPDACTLYFSSEVAGGERQLYQARRR